jgi:hypothetical protein
MCGASVSERERRGNRVFAPRLAVAAGSPTRQLGLSPRFAIRSGVISAEE